MTVKAHLVQVLQAYAQKLQEWDSPPSSTSQGSPSVNMLGSSGGAKSLNAAEQQRAIRAQAAHENRPIGVGLGAMASYAQTIGAGASVGPSASSFVPLAVQKKQLQQQQQQQSSASAGPAAGVGLRRGGVAQTSLTNVTGTVSTAAEQVEQQHVGGDDSSSATAGLNSGASASSGGSGSASSNLAMLFNVLGSRLPPNFSQAQLAAALGNLSGSSSAINTDQLQMLVHQLSNLNISTASSASDSK